MTSLPSPDVTMLLGELREGRGDALDRLLPIVYEELRRIARQQLRRAGRDPTLATTALVHEAYLRLVDQTRAEWSDRGHFLSVCAIAMRQILLNHARQRRVLKRGGGRRSVTLHEHHAVLDAQADELIALDDALRWLDSIEPRLARVVECRYFAGYTEEETASALGVTERTVRRDWVKAKGLLRTALGE